MKNLCKQNWYQITLLFLFCVTVFLRFYKLTVLPDVLHIDEAALGYNSWCLANYGTDRYLNVLPFYPQNFYGGQSPLYTYPVSYTHLDVYKRQPSYGKPRFHSTQ